LNLSGGLFPQSLSQLAHHFNEAPLTGGSKVKLLEFKLQSCSLVQACGSAGTAGGVEILGGKEMTGFKQKHF
jgi:hypothetical protein